MRMVSLLLYLQWNTQTLRAIFANVIRCKWAPGHKTLSSQSKISAFIIIVGRKFLPIEIQTSGSKKSEEEKTIPKNVFIKWNFP